MERDLLKKRPRTLRRNRCEVRNHESDAIQVLYRLDVPYSEGIKERYYKWLNWKPFTRVQEQRRLEAEIKAAHQRTRETCGPERLRTSSKSRV